jgi:hypothetical protein
MDKQCTSLLERTPKHLTYLAALINGTFKYNAHQFRTEHETLENALAQFLKEFRSHIKEVFAITAHIIEGKEVVGQLDIMSKLSFNDYKQYAL